MMEKHYEYKKYHLIVGDGKWNWIPKSWLILALNHFLRAVQSQVKNSRRYDPFSFFSAFLGIRIKISREDPYIPFRIRIIHSTILVILVYFFYYEKTTMHKKVNGRGGGFLFLVGLHGHNFIDKLQRSCHSLHCSPLMSIGKSRFVKPSSMAYCIVIIFFGGILKVYMCIPLGF